MHNLIWPKKWSEFNTNGGTGITINEDIVEIYSGAIPSSSYMTYFIQVLELSEIVVTSIAKCTEGTANIGIDFYNSANQNLSSQSIKVIDNTFAPTTLKAFAPRGTVYARLTFGVWGGLIGRAFYKIPQAFVSRGNGIPDILSAQIKYDVASTTWSILNSVDDYKSIGISSISWDATNKCLNVFLDNMGCTKFPTCFVSPIGRTNDVRFVPIAENWPRLKNRVQIYWKNLSTNAVTDLTDINIGLYINLLILR